MLTKLLIVVIIFVIFISVLFKLNKKEGFESPTTSSFNLNTECYETELTNCVGNCNTVEKVNSIKCLSGTRCNTLSESECDRGCVFQKDINSNCENKTLGF